MDASVVKTRCFSPEGHCRSTVSSVLGAENAVEVYLGSMVDTRKWMSNLPRPIAEVALYLPYCLSTEFSFLWRTLKIKVSNVIRKKTRIPSYTHFVYIYGGSPSNGTGGYLMVSFPCLWGPTSSSPTCTWEISLNTARIWWRMLRSSSLTRLNRVHAWSNSTIYLVECRILWPLTIKGPSFYGTLEWIKTWALPCVPELVSTCAQLRLIIILSYLIMA